MFLQNMLCIYINQKGLFLRNGRTFTTYRFDCIWLADTLGASASPGTFVLVWEILPCSAQVITRKWGNNTRLLLPLHRWTWECQSHVGSRFYCPHCSEKQHATKCMHNAHERIKRLVYMRRMTTLDDSSDRRMMQNNAGGASCKLRALVWVIGCSEATCASFVPSIWVALMQTHSGRLFSTCLSTKIY